MLSTACYLTTSKLASWLSPEFTEEMSCLALHKHSQRKMPPALTSMIHVKWKPGADGELITGMTASAVIKKTGSLSEAGIGQRARVA